MGALQPAGQLRFTAFCMVAGSETDPIHARTRDGMAIAEVAGKLRGKKPELRLA